MPAQDRLLRAVEYGEITRIGASKPISVDVRIVAATNENLPRQVEHGRFRADLLDRLSFEVITLPPLRARQGDIPLLAEHFGRRMAVELEWPNWPGFTPAALAALEAYPLARQRARTAQRRRARGLSPRGPRAADRRDAVRSVPFALGADGRRRRHRRAARAGRRPRSGRRATCRRRQPPAPTARDQRLPLGGRRL